MKNSANETHDTEADGRFNHRNVIPDEGWSALAADLGMSKRQIQVVRAVTGDATEFAIAAELGLSVHTHLDRIHRKFGVHSRVELVIFLFAAFLRLTATGATGLPPVCPDPYTQILPSPNRIKAGKKFLKINLYMLDTGV